MREFYSLLQATFMVGSVSACGVGTPSMTYHEATDQEMSSLQDGELLFKLRTTNINIVPPPSTDKAASVSSPPPNRRLHKEAGG